VVHFDKEFTRYEPSGDGAVTAHFADGTSATGDLLVGADGARSRVRRQLLPHARRIDTPAIGVGGKLPLTSQTQGWLPDRITATKNMVMPPRDFLFTAVFRRREQPADVAARLRDRLAAAGLDTDQLLRDAADNDYIMWAFVAHRRSYPSGTDGLRGKALREVVEQRMARWHPVLRRLVAESDPDTIEQFDFAAAAPVKAWPDRSVTLLGDAIHYMPPVGGMGGNTALQDAQRLCTALATAASGAEPLATALRDYQAEMLDRGFKTVRGVRLYTRMAISRSRLLRTTARAFFRLCGAVGPLRRAVFSD
jgi:2-polyprenyl-6-methoxyphenol hydroxylase-like FAD-dependent oxidoreductase